MSDTDTSILEREAGDGDYLSEATHENGNYMNRCLECERLFIGYKRRVICKYCADRNKP